MRRVCANAGKLSGAKRTTNAYVVFENAASAAAAAAANGAVWPSKQTDDAAAAAYLGDDAAETFHLRVDRATPARDGGEHLRTAFVGNAPRDASEEGLRSFFAAHLAEAGGHAAIENVRVVRDPKEHRGVGVAYVLLKDRAALPAALELDGAAYAEPGGAARPLRVTPCGKRTKKDAPGAAARKDGGVKEKAVAFGARRRLEKKARRAEARSAAARAPTAPRASGAAAWQGQRAAAKKPKAAAKKRTVGKKTFVGKRKKT